MNKIEESKVIEILSKYEIDAESGIFSFEIHGDLTTPKATFVYLEYYRGKFCCHTVSSSWWMDTTKKSIERLTIIYSILSELKSLNPKLVWGES